MHIGLIGGIGVAATVAYYQRLTRAVSGPFDLTIEHADTATLVANMTADQKDAQAQVYLRHIRRLAGAGCDCVAITSLGGHFCYDEIAAISPLPLVSGVAPLDAYFQTHGIARVGILGTRLVMETRLYGQLQRTEAVVPDDQLDLVGQTYLDMAGAMHCSDAQRAFFFETGRNLINEQGADAVVLAGTDLTLAFGGQDPGYRVIDALDVHVAHLADLAKGTVPL